MLFLAVPCDGPGGSLWKPPFLLKSLCIVALVIGLTLAGYWIKCQLGIDIIPGTTWEKNVPFLRSFQRTERVTRTSADATSHMSAIFYDALDKVTK